MRALVEPPMKRKAELLQATSLKTSSPFKKKKIDEHSHTLVTPPQSPFMQLTDNVSLPLQEQQLLPTYVKSNY